MAGQGGRRRDPEWHLSGFGGILQADAYGGYNGLYNSDRAAGAVTPAFCWSHARRGFFELADITRNPRRGRTAAVISPIALEAVKRMDALFAIERRLNGLAATARRDERQRQSAPLVADLEAWLRDQRARLVRGRSDRLHAVVTMFISTVIGLFSQMAIKSSQTWAFRSSRTYTAGCRRE